MRINRGYAIFLVCLVIGGLVSMSMGLRMGFDDFNYHIYNGYAFWSGRVFSDIPSTPWQNYLNPLLDVINYKLVFTLNDFPRLYSFIQGLWYGAFIFLVYTISDLFIIRDVPYRRMLVILSVGIGVTGFAVYTQAGTMFNEVQVSLIFLTGFYIVSKNIFFSDTRQWMKVLLGSALMGMAMGLKLTAGVYCLGFAVALLSVSFKIDNPIRTILISALGGLLGFFVINGWWMAMLYSHFANPFFPYYNEIFKSPFFDTNNWHDTRFFPRSVFDAITFPFHWAYWRVGYGAEIAFRDLRWSSLYILVCCSVIAWIVKKSTSIKAIFFDIGISRIFLLVYILVSFIIWEKTFAILRYTIAIEALTGIAYVILFLCIAPIIMRNKIYICVFSVISLCFFTFTSKYSSWGQYTFDDKIMDVENVRIPDDNLLIMLGGVNLYTIPYLNTNARAVARAPRNELYFKASKEIGDVYEKDKVIIASDVLPIPNMSLYLKDLYCKPFNLFSYSTSSICIQDGKLNDYFDIKSVLPDEYLSHKSNKLVFKNWNYAEREHRWSHFKDAIILFYTDAPEALNGVFFLDMWTYGKQTVSLKINNISVYNETMNNFNGVIEIPFDKTILKQGLNELTFDLPDAAAINGAGKDYPLLSIALRSLKFK